MKHLSDNFTNKDADIFLLIAKGVKSGTLVKEELDKLILECSSVEAQRLARHIYGQDMDVRFVREIFVWINELN